MKTNYLLFACAIIITLTILPGCKKVQDVIGNHRLCKIKTLKTFDRDAYVKNRSFHITYNEYDNPVTVSGGDYSIQFRYDKQNRLSDCIYYAEWSGYVIEWNTYTYKPGNKTIIDTVYVYTSSYVTDSIHPDAASYSYEYTYDLDNAGRISRETTRYSFAPGSSVTNFIYNNRGNLAKTLVIASDGSEYEYPEVKYDDKTNLWQTDKVLQFLYKDYSVNNSLKATGYNQFGLPIKAVDNNHENGYSHPVIFSMYDWTELEIEYDCAAKESYK